MNEQLEIKICGREFGISLKGYNAQASQEIRDMFEKKNVDLLEIVRAYLDVVHQKCELESSLQNIAMKLDNVAIKPSGEACEADSEDKVCEADAAEAGLDSGAESILETSADLEAESKKVDSSTAISASQAESNSKKPKMPESDLPSPSLLDSGALDSNLPKLDSAKSSQKDIKPASQNLKTISPNLKSASQDLKPASQSLNPIPQSLFETDFKLASNALL